MSIRSVRSEIRTAMKTSSTFEDKRLTKCEAQAIVKDAERGPVTKGELAEVVNLMKNGVEPGGMMTRAAPELRGDSFYMDSGAKSVLSDFLTRNAGPVVRPPVVILPAAGK